MARVYGIECRLKPKGRAKVKEVLNRIRQRHPEDFEELKRLVRVIEPYDGDDENFGGEWKQYYPKEDDRSTWNYGYDRTPGVMKLRDIVGLPNAVIAHEFGHAMTRYEDLKRRKSFHEEWASELTADWYAYRWGFGREIAATRNNRSFMHHCVGPGQELEVDGCIYRVTRNFCLNFVRKGRFGQFKAN